MPLAMQQQVLVVGNDAQRRKLLESYLQDFEGTAIVAARGVDGFHLVKALKPKVLVVDCPFGDLAGEDLCRAAKQDSANTGMMVIFVGDFGSPDFDIEAMIESGADDCCPPIKNEFRKRVPILL